MTAPRAAAGPRVTFAIRPLGAMIGPAVFVLPDGRQVSPLHIAPWEDDPAAADLPGILRALRGEWPCVPFGYSVPVTGDTPARWAGLLGAAEPGEEVHGPSSNSVWRWEESAPGALSLSLDYPPDHPVRRVERVVAADPAAAALDFTLRIETRAACTLPLGLHFTFALPARPGSARIDPGAFRTGRTYPGTVEPGGAAFAIDRTFADLSAVPDRDGGAVDASAVPLQGAVEELLQLDGTLGEAALARPAEGWRARLTWDPQVFPSLLLWYSNRGRTAAPWDGRHLALGMEPICSPFGFGPATARGANPVSAEGTPTARAFDPGESIETRYRLEVEAIKGA